MRFGTHNNLINSPRWIPILVEEPKPYTDVYLLCNYMMIKYVVKGQLANGTRINSDGDPDVFFRSAIVAWQPV